MIKRYSEKLGAIHVDNRLAADAMLPELANTCAGMDIYFYSKTFNICLCYAEWNGSFHQMFTFIHK